jgi:hypothetical protein
MKKRPEDSTLLDVLIPTTWTGDPMGAIWDWIREDATRLP